MKTSERSFEETIEACLVRHGPDAQPWDDTPMVETTPFGEDPPGGFQRRQQEDYDRHEIPGPRMAGQAVQSI